VLRRQTDANMRILLVEDEKKLCDLIARALEAERYAVDVALDGQAGWEMAQACDYDLLILDLMLPTLSGTQILTRIRGKNQEVPILILTARDGTREKVQHFEAGADDYLTKPFALQELLARLRALLRRVVPAEGDDPEVLTFADLSMDLGSREVRRGNRTMELTRTEFTLLEMFLRRPRRVLERSFILEEVWGYDFPTTANSLEVYVGYLRRKTEAEDEPRLIHTVRGVGYVLKES
jgi:two-component system, OmpR family, response regulator MprA